MECKHITKNGRCGLKGCYAYKHSCYTKDCCKCWESLTTADRIRSMNNEELAEFLMDVSMGLLIDKRIMNVKDWLSQPTEED